MNVTGVWVPLVTPFDELGHVDKGALTALVEIMVEQGVDGIVAAGTTGEGYALTMDERHLVISTIKKQLAGRIPLIAAVGGMSTNEAIDHALLAKRLECDGLMVAAPAYVLPTTRELITHVTKVINAAGLTTVLYDYPARTGVSYTQEVLEGLAGHELVVGIKEASGDLSRISMIQQNFGSQIAVVCGADLDSPTFFEAGVDSWIGGIANALPHAHRGIMNPETRAQAHAAVAPLLEYIESGDYIAKTKALMTLLGAEVGGLRGPLLAAESDVVSELAARLEQAGSWAPRLA